MNEILNPSSIMKKFYRGKGSRKALNILQKINTNELPKPELLQGLINTFRDDWILRILDKVSKISVEIIEVVIEKENRSIITTGFLNSLIECEGRDVMASRMLQVLRKKGIKIDLPLRHIQQLVTAHNYLRDHINNGSRVDISKSIESILAPPENPRDRNYPVPVEGSHRHDPLKVPHNLNTPFDVSLAMNADVLGLGRENYQKILKYARYGMAIKKPEALLRARPVSKDFYVLKERTVHQKHESYKQTEGLNSLTDISLLHDQIPLLDELKEPESLNSYLNYAEKKSDSLSMQPGSFLLLKHMALKEVIRKELRSLVHSNKTKSIPYRELKKLIVGYTLHEGMNHDIVGALKISSSEENDLLFKNSLAELYFSRIPGYLKSMFIDDPRIIPALRERLCLKISKLSLPANIKMALFHKMPGSSVTKADLFINKINELNSLIRNIQGIDDKFKLSVCGYIDNTISELTRSEDVYKKLFLHTKELEKYYNLYVPNNNLVTCKESYTERTIRQQCNNQPLHMYPAKDYLELEKFRWSNDCTKDTLGIKHLMTPNFINIRLFKENREYCGNIYMLQLENESKQYLLVDRIQTNSFSTQYVFFYKTLQDAFKEMFEGFPYHEILMPNDQVSNNKSLNQIYHGIKKSYQKKQVFFKLSGNLSSDFESLRSNVFRVLCKKTVARS